MTTVIKFNDCKQNVSIQANEDVIGYADIDIVIENHEKGEKEPRYTYLFLKEHEAVYLANAILRFVEQVREENKRYIEEQTVHEEG